ncbi:hypothetical protein FH972_022060 [Carpinus fangiana]|uniref:Uncharacterized protein n=1 Tax=Carpinus fangiana TaxID=176857 RepID=A0A5N6KRS4_9ROSI|nr:hypothetical protein FH972_022060 [Carpinus fangiana]
MSVQGEFPNYVDSVSKVEPVQPILDPPGSYLADHVEANGPNDARPTALKIIRDQKLEGKLEGLVFLITGCTGGLGIETARAIHATGADVYITGRNDELGSKVAAELGAAAVSPKPNGKVEYIHMELDNLESVRAGAENFLKQSGGKCNVLICNAGVMRTPEGITCDGFETQFGTNHLGHFQLFQKLKSALLSSSTPQFNSRAITLSSQGHMWSTINFDNYDLKKSPKGYDPWIAYGQSKTANIYMASEIERRYAGQGLHALAVHPGGIFTGLGKHAMDMIEQIFAHPEVARYSKSVAQGAATTVWAAVAREWEGKGGRYLEDCREAPVWYQQEGAMQWGYAPHAYDKESEQRLWKESLAMIGEQDDLK